MIRPKSLLPLLLLAAVAACGGGDTASAAPAPPAEAPSTALAPSSAAAPAPSADAGLVDSIHSDEEMMRRFRDGLTEPARLSGGEASREALVGRFVRAVAEQDTAAVREMVMKRAEFAWLYHPTSDAARPPRKTTPQLAWFLTLENSQKGITRVFNRLGGQKIDYVRHECEDRPRVEGESRLWERCAVTFRAGGAEETMRLFGTIVERGGHFKFISYANDF